MIAPLGTCVCLLWQILSLMKMVMMMMRTMVMVIIIVCPILSLRHTSSHHLHTYMNLNIWKEGSALQCCLSVSMSVQTFHSRQFKPIYIAAKLLSLFCV